PSIVRVSVAHRATIGGLGGEFLEETDPNRIDLSGPNNTGEGLVGPVTFGLDVEGLPNVGALAYVLRVGTTDFHSSTPSIRGLPTDLRSAAGLPVVDTVDRQLTYTVEVRKGSHVLVGAEHTLTVGPSDGTFVEATAPIAPATVASGASVTVHYDLTGVRSL